MYLIDSQDQQLLIDCGVGMCDIHAFLQQQGFKHIRVIVTHAHFDHVGGLQYFPADSIIAAPAIVKNLYDPQLLALTPEYTKHVTKEFCEEQQQSVEQISAEYCSTLPETLPTLAPYTESEVSVGEFTLQLIPLPGHTDDSIVLYEPTLQWLFSGDVLYHGTIFVDLPNSNKQEYITSLQQLHELQISQTFPGHNHNLSTQQTTEGITKWLQQLE